jgi:hypothetical protein
MGKERIRRGRRFNWRRRGKSELESREREGGKGTET